MKKRISFTTQGQRADIGEYFIHQILPNRYTDAIGPFVFLDHLLLVKYLPGEPVKSIHRNGSLPGRGIKALTYILNGEDGDRGSEAWMKGKESIYIGEVVNTDLRANNLLTHALQFWISHPSQQKATSPAYLPIDANEVPKQMLTDNRGWLKLVFGEYENLVCKVPSQTKQFLYHIHLEPGKQISTTTENGLEYAIFLPLHDAVINDIECKKGDVIEFEKQEGIIEITNYYNVGIDIIIFGGENKRSLA